MKEVSIFNNEILNTIHSDGDMVSLTDLWKANGSIESRAPKFWLTNEETKGYIKAVAKMLKVSETYLLKIKRGKTGGTWGHKQLALEYAQYLDPKLAVLVNQSFFERIEEEKNPELIIDRAINTYKKKGKTDEWIGGRIRGKVSRNQFTGVCSSHGVSGDGFRNVTNAIYTPLFGGSTQVVRQKLGIDKTVNIRDNMSDLQLAAVNLAELLAANNIEIKNLQGNASCEVEARNTSMNVAKAILESKK